MSNSSDESGGEVAIPGKSSLPHILAQQEDGEENDDEELSFRPEASNDGDSAVELEPGSRFLGLPVPEDIQALYQRFQSEEGPLEEVYVVTAGTSPLPVTEASRSANPTSRQQELRSSSDDAASMIPQQNHLKSHRLKTIPPSSIVSSTGAAELETDVEEVDRGALHLLCQPVQKASTSPPRTVTSRYKKMGRGTYNCNQCGEKRRGHKCPMKLGASSAPSKPYSEPLESQMATVGRWLVETEAARGPPKGDARTMINKKGESDQKKSKEYAKAPAIKRKERQTKKGRGEYKCGQCGQLKKGHICKQSQGYILAIAAYERSKRKAENDEQEDDENQDGEEEMKADGADEPLDIPNKDFNDSDNDGDEFDSNSGFEVAMV